MSVFGEVPGPSEMAVGGIFGLKKRSQKGSILEKGVRRGVFLAKSAIFEISYPE